jgi:tRNA A-37 threonylcarbamoyl transferase component Bud32
MVWVFREGASLVEDIDLWNGWIRGNGARKLAEPGGRAPVYHIEDRGIGGMVLRGFHHGGLFAKLMGNRFLGASRFLAELRVSEAIRREAVPTPEVLALHFRRAGAGTYRGWILTRYIGGGENLRRWVEAGLPGNPERRMVLRLAARTVGSLHAAGCLHPDLNLSNLLLAHGKIFVLDLDGASVKRPLGVGARCSNLLRLYRSLAKAMDRVEPLSLEDRWAFIKAYSGGDRDDSRALWRHLSSRWSLARARSHLSRGLRHVMHQESPGPPTGDGRR